MRRLVLIDGHALLHRAYHAIPVLTTSKGEQVNAVYGFTLIVLRVLDELKPEWVVGTFDRSAPTFRHTQYTGYKANRSAAPDDLHSQLPRVQEILKSLNIPIFELDGYEADDLIGTISRIAIEKNEVDEVIIVTGDMDATQLVGPKVKVYTARKGIADTVLYDEAAVKERYSLTPAQIPDYKGLAGDSSDNIPGVMGIGAVGAKKLISEYGSVEGLYKNLDKIPERMRKILSEGQESAFMSKELATIDQDAPISIDLASCRLHDYDYDNALKLLQELEFKSLIAKLPDYKNRQNNKELQESGQSSLLVQEEKSPLVQILEEMKEVGVLVDCSIFEKLSKEIGEKIAEIEKNIYSEVGHEFNLNSPKQLSEVLYNELNLTPGKQKKTHPSTDNETLTMLIGAHPVIELILQYRELFKLKSTYIDSIPSCVTGEDKRVHADWRDDVARTGRLSSNNPNLQNIPVRGEWGQKIRSAFIAPTGYYLLSADYNQIELRVMAHLSQDPQLIKIFQEKKDIHTTTASWIFHKPEEQITKDERRVAKTVNFGVLYMMSAYGLSRSLQIDPKIAAEFIDSYYTRFAKVKEYQEKILKEAYEKGYLETITGFKRYFLELQSPNHILRNAGERMASNFPVQGSAADVIKQAMIDITKIIKEKKLKSRLIMQVHDELVFEVLEEEIKEVTPLIKERMENALPLIVPLIVDLKIGKNWGEMSTPTP